MQDCCGLLEVTTPFTTDLRSYSCDEIEGIEQLRELVEEEDPNALAHFSTYVGRCVRGINSDNLQEKQKYEEIAKKLETFGILKEKVFRMLMCFYGVAIRSGNAKGIELLCKLGMNMRWSFGDDPVILYALKECRDCEDLNKEKAIKRVIAILVRLRADINARDREKQKYTAVHYAARNGMYDMVELFLQHNALIDIEIKGTTARAIIENHQPQILQKYASSLQSNENDVMRVRLFDVLYRGDESSFIYILENNSHHDINDEDGWHTFVQIAADKGYPRVLEYLLNRGADANKTSGRDVHAVVIAATKGNYAPLQFLLHYPGTDLTVRAWNGATLFNQVAFILLQKYTHDPNDLECVDILFRHLIDKGIDINEKSSNVSAFSYTQEGKNPLLMARGLEKETPVVFLILKHGGFFGTLFEEECLNRLPEKVLNAFLNDCIGYGDNGDLTEELTLDFKFMAPSHYKNYIGSSPKKPPVNTKFPEMKTLYALSRSRLHRNVLLHPVIDLFLQLKWLKLYPFYLANIFLFLAFAVTLSFFVNQLQFSTSNLSDNDTSNNNYDPSSFDTSEMSGNVSSYRLSETSNVVAYSGHSFAIKFFLSLFWILLLVREIIQVFISIKMYFKDPDNLLEMIMLILTMWALVDSNSPHTKYVATIAVMAAYVELMFMIGKHPNIAKYITMFSRVSIKSIFMITWFSPLILSFAYGFFLLFKNDITDNYFQSLSSSLLKTVIMLTGEYDFESLEFGVSPVLSQFVLVAFIFFVVVILMNLLNALAVSDTQAIIDEAELLCCLAKVNLLTSIESVVLDYHIESSGQYRIKKSHHIMNTPKICYCPIYFIKFLSCLCNIFLSPILYAFKKMRSHLDVNVLPLDPVDLPTKIEWKLKHPYDIRPWQISEISKNVFFKYILGVDLKSALRNCAIIHKKTNTTSENESLSQQISDIKKVLDRNTLNTVPEVIATKLMHQGTALDTLKNVSIDHKDKICAMQNEMAQQNVSLKTIETSLNRQTNILVKLNDELNKAKQIESTDVKIIHLEQKIDLLEQKFDLMMSKIQEIKNYLPSNSQS